MLAAVTLRRLYCQTIVHVKSTVWLVFKFHCCCVQITCTNYLVPQSLNYNVCNLHSQNKSVCSCYTSFCNSTQNFILFLNLLIFSQVFQKQNYLLILPPLPPPVKSGFFHIFCEFPTRIRLNAKNPMKIRMLASLVSVRFFPSRMRKTLLIRNVRVGPQLFSSNIFVHNILLFLRLVFYKNSILDISIPVFSESDISVIKVTQENESVVLLSDLF